MESTADMIIPNGVSSSITSDESAVALFQEFLRFRTISGEGPKGSYKEAANWLKHTLINQLQRGKDASFDCEIIEPIPNKPIVIGSIFGSEPSLPCIVLNGHYDVVPVAEEHWDVNPFEAVKTNEGHIFGRGAQDMKCVLIQYIISLSRGLEKGWTPRRTIHLTFVPDEEIGGREGMKLLLVSPQWERMQPVGLVLDEGLANTGEAFTVFKGERKILWLRVEATGPTGHASRFIENAAMPKLIEVCQKALAFREEQRKKLGVEGGCAHASSKKLGDVATLNLTMLKGGFPMDDKMESFALNTIPTVAYAGFDVRIPLNMSVKDISDLLNEWCAAEGVKWEFAPWHSTSFKPHCVSSTDREKNPFWGTFLDSMEEMGHKIEVEIFPAATDSRMIRELGINAFGFSPMRRSPILLHENNEYIDESVFVEGIGVYEKLLPRLADTEPFIAPSSPEACVTKKLKTSA
eukprot:530201_1